jgi:hypothetical protein
MSEKLTKLVPVKLGETMHADLLKACGGLRQRASWIRARIAEGITKAKEEKRLGRVTREEAKAIAEAHQFNIDVVAALRERIAQISAS